MSEIKKESSPQLKEASSYQPFGELQNIHTAYRLNGKNYLKGYQLVHTFLKGKEKPSHLLGTRPKKEDPRFDAWDEEDSKVLAWLWNSMTPEINDTVLLEIVSY
ncbi:hypothetical protein UlMin_036462 [Ulmus minor]